ncbi:28S ribosomal protein S29, mitochondrial-like [Paramacrobiotus metropolitanus]|uniref:28S ribosomal protein S29, mitochondrial-like n=1 Tax=Paramacrobiotus metropolitanus TaxID=2943436 RepID=UPI002445C683|nr:28S ribosomal protein S29, mitochondrial-like [Paramacrobiotus metropolitanus]
MLSLRVAKSFGFLPFENSVRCFRVVFPSLQHQQVVQPMPVSTEASGAENRMPFDPQEPTRSPTVVQRITAKRTTLQNPADHTRDHEAFYYTVPNDHYDKYFGFRTLPSLFRDNVKSFQECALMIREPGLEVIECVKRSNPAFPPVRYCLFGRDGVGKTMTLAYLLHFFLSNRWLVFHMPRLVYWSRRYKEVQENTFKPGRIDLPVDSMEWLQHFLSQNGDLLKGSAESSNKILTHQKYIFSKREETPEGAPLLDVVELGIKRAKYANDCIGIIVKEMKLNAMDNRVKVAVVVDSVNALWGPTKIPRVDRTTVPPESLSLFTHIKNAIKNDWHNAAIVTTVDRVSMVDEPALKDVSGNIFPRYLLKKDGWEAMDPFVPVSITDYNDKEFTNAMDYYLEQRWFSDERVATQKGRDELKFVTNKNPKTLDLLATRM